MVESGGWVVESGGWVSGRVRWVGGWWSQRTKCRTGYTWCETLISPLSVAADCFASCDCHYLGYHVYSTCMIKPHAAT